MALNGQLADRVEALSPSATLAVVAKAKALADAGESVLSFAAGEPDFDTPQAVKDAVVRALQAGRTKYGPIPGDLASRRAISGKLVRENGLKGVTPEHVVVSSGGKHSLYNLFMALLNPGDRAILPVPAWVSFRPQMELAGAEVVELPTTAAADFKITPEQLDAAIDERARVLLFNSPSNPCGTMYRPDEVRALAEVIRKAAEGRAPRLIVVCDEIYDRLVYPEIDAGAEHLSMGSIPEVAERVVTVNGLSKTYAMTGWRIGYFAGQGEFGLRLAEGVKKLQGQSTTSIPTFLMDAIPVAIEQCGEEAEAMRVAFAERALLMYRGVSAMPGMVCPMPTGAMYLFPDVSAHFGKTSAGGAKIGSAMDFATALLEEHKVAVVPGEDFGTGGENCIRLTFACSSEQISEGVERIGAFIASLR